VVVHVYMVENCWNILPVDIIWVEVSVPSTRFFEKLIISGLKLKIWFFTPLNVSVVNVQGLEILEIELILVPLLHVVHLAPEVCGL
jgi:hypothetical protein